LRTALAVRSPGEAAPLDGDALSARPVQVLFEPFEGKPYDLFFFEVGGRRFVGRKTPFRFERGGSVQELKCALVAASMVLGLVVRDQVTERGVLVYYRPLEEGERRAWFAAFHSRPEHDLYYPYPYLTAEGRRERCAPDEYWNTSPERVESLGEGERVLRQHTLDLLADCDLAGARLYDPACSTGEFLSALKARHPSAYVIGQDKSREMVELSRTRLDEAHWGDARHPAVPEGSVDWVFCRFLNVDVVPAAAAHALFLQAARCCREGGHLVVLGHTPILVAGSFFEALGLGIRQRIGYSRADDGVFQYYVLHKTGPLREPPASLRASFES
jgi:isonocardicin synthase